MNRFTILIGLCAFALSTFVPMSQVMAEDTATSAKLETVSDADRINLSYATRYHVTVTLPSDIGVTLDEIRSVMTFALLVEKTGKQVPIREVTYRGVTSRVGDREQYHKLIVWAELDPTEEHSLTIRYPNGELHQNIKIASLKVQSDQNLILDIATNRTTLDVGFLSSESADSLGVEYDLKITAFHHRSQDKRELFKIALTSEGEIGTDNNLDDFQNSLTAGISLDYRQNHIENMRTPQIPSGSDYVYPFGIRLKPVEFEASQDFDLVDYTLKLQAISAIPYSDYPIFWLHNQTKTDRHFFPMLATAGLTYVEEVESDGGTRTEKTTYRLDTELVYEFPLADRYDFKSRWRTFTDLENDTFDNFFEAGLVYFLDEERNTGLEVSFRNGSLPPDFNDSDSVRLGLNVKLF